MAGRIRAPRGALAVDAPVDDAAGIPGVAALVERLSDSLALVAPQVRRYRGGMSNLTLLLSDGDREYVVRRPPVGDVLIGAHDMAREHRAMSALQDRLPFVPRVIDLGTDPATPGGAFLVMERRAGYVVRDTWPETGGGPAVRAALSRSVVQVMCDLHAVDVSSPEVASLGRPIGFFERQVEGWRRRSRASSSRDNSAADVVFAWLASAPRPPQGPAVVHNDMKLDNLMLAVDDLSRIVALLDWELATLGDPLVDLGTLLAYWAEPGDDPALYGGTLPPVALPGFLTRAQLVDGYAAYSGRAVDAVHVYRVFGMVRIAVLGQQLLRRHDARPEDDPRIERFRVQVPALWEHASQMVT